MGKLLEGKTAVITGASQGFGETSAKLLAKHGAKVVITARRKDKLEEVAAQIREAGGEALAVPGDVTVLDDCKNVLKTTVDQFGKIDILVNNAGMSNMYFIEHTTDEEYNKVIALNQTAIFYYCREAIGYMKKQGTGNIINISSVNALRPVAGFAYSVSKYAVIGMTKCIAYEFAGTGIRCNCLCPGVIKTEMSASVLEEGKNVDEDLMKLLPKRMDMSVPFSEQEEMASNVLYLASDLSITLNGAVIEADKGHYI